MPKNHQSMNQPKTPASRWYVARDNKKFGPYTWQQLRTLAERGELLPSDMLLQEGTKKWVGAGASEFALLFTRIPSRGFSCPLVALIGIAVCALVAVSGATGYLLFIREKPVDHPPIVEASDRQKDKDPPKTTDGGIDKKPPDEKPPKTTPREVMTTRFVDQLNRYRKSAGLGTITFDAELSRGCQAHAQYLVKHVDPDNLGAADLANEDPEKPGFTAEGQRAAQGALIAAAEPVEALEQWMASLFPRVLLLTPGIRSVGIGIEKTKDGWICVVDSVRGSGEPIVVVPARKQFDVPLSFSSGREMPDDKAFAGYPISVTFPLSVRVADAMIELRDAKGKMIDGWTWTPQKPLANGGQNNTVAFIPKGLLQGRTVYQVKASAKIDGKAWNLEWPFTTADDVDSDGTRAKKTLAKVNEYRAHAGLQPVALDDKLSGPCLAHARYLVMNEGHPSLQGLSAHDEDLKLPDASKEGDAAGKASVIAIGDYDPMDGVESWMGTLYHRVPILEPKLKTIGFGCARGRRQGWVVVLNVSTGVHKLSPTQPVFCPAPDQTDVPVSFPNGGEEPNPIPEGKSGRAGFPITASFPKDAPLKNAQGKLTDDQGTEIPCWFSSPEKPANPRYADRQGNTVCLIGKAPLTPNTKFHVHFQGRIAGKAWERKWAFTTGAAGPTVAAAARQVVDRLNRHRADVGLSAVTIDDTLSRGCQLHAEYLVKNADMLLKANARVDDEDPNLPGFTRDGLRSAQQSLVFTDAPRPVIQIDDLMASVTGRLYLLEPRLNRVGIGCAHDIGRGWRCVLDANGGRGDARFIYPAAKQENVPTVGYDRLNDVNTRPGFPISVTFPHQAKLGKVQAALTDANGKDIEIHISSPSKPLDAKRQPGIVGIHPLAPLQPGQAYTVTVSVIVNGVEWRQTWQFTTKKKERQ
jgi:uncharacterized protein YkwD